MLYWNEIINDEAILLQWCQGRWRGAGVTKECLETTFRLSSTLLRKLCVNYANGFDNVESGYFVYSSPVFHIAANNKMYLRLQYPIAVHKKQGEIRSVRHQCLFCTIERTRWRSWLRQCPTNRMVVGSIPYGVTGSFYWSNISSRTMALGSWG
jgi:hypothetical protein